MNSNFYPLWVNP